MYSMYNYCSIYFVVHIYPTRFRVEHQPYSRTRQPKIHILSYRLNRNEKELADTTNCQIIFALHAFLWDKWYITNSRSDNLLRKRSCRPVIFTSEHSNQLYRICFVKYTCKPAILRGFEISSSCNKKIRDTQTQATRPEILSIFSCLNSFNFMKEKIIICNSCYRIIFIVNYYDDRIFRYFRWYK